MRAHEEETGLLFFSPLLLELRSRGATRELVSYINRPGIFCTLPSEIGSEGAIIVRAALYFCLICCTMAT